MLDIDRLKREHPITQIIAGYGISLHSRGRTLVGRCPFHPDGGRPNLTIFPESQSWFCFRCGVGGDVISFVQRIEGISFPRAIARLTGCDHRNAPWGTSPTPQPLPRRQPAAGPAERACLAAAVALYHDRLLHGEHALAYVEGRGIDRTTLARCRVGYAMGNELAPYLRSRGLPIAAAIRIGLLRRDGRDFLAGRIVVPELRAGQPIWLIGRTLGSSRTAPKYLALPGRKPLLGWGALADTRSVWVCEGVFDWLTLRAWHYPAVALNGTHVRASVLRALESFQRIYLVLDRDEAGQAATRTLTELLGARACPVTLPDVKDVADLARWPDGRARFARAVAASEPLPAVAA